MNKVEQILIGVFGVGAIPYFMQCIRKGMRYGCGSGMMRYFKSELITLHGALFALSVIGLITVFIVHAIIKRKKRSEVRITKADKIWFAISFLPVVLLLLYGLYGAATGVNFLWSSYYGIDGFMLAVIFGGILILPVLPLCIIWQIIFLVTRHKAKKAAAAVKSE
jgi:hypothetical protein